MKKLLVVVALLLALTGAGCGGSWWTPALHNARDHTEIPYGYSEVTYQTMKEDINRLAGKQVSFVCLVTKSQDKTTTAGGDGQTEGEAVLADSCGEEQYVQWEWRAASDMPRTGEVWRLDGRAEETASGLPGLSVTGGVRLSIVRNPDWPAG